VRANIPKRDNIFDDDYVGILFDTFNDSRKAYEFDFNPLGVQADGIWTDGQGEDFNPESSWSLKAWWARTVDGRNSNSVQIAALCGGQRKLWGAHFWRRIKRFNNELDMWMPLNSRHLELVVAGRPSHGSEGISTRAYSGANPQPYLVRDRKPENSADSGATKRRCVDPEGSVNDPIKFDPGLTEIYNYA